MKRPSRPVIDLENSGVPEAPASPESLKETGLSTGLMHDMILRTLYQQGVMLGLDMARFLRLPFKIIEEGIRFLKDEKLIEVTGGELIGRVVYKFALTDQGRRRAQDAHTQCAYVGPAPVPLEDYVEQTYRQAVTGIACSPETLRASFGHLVLKEDLFNAIGPAVVSGRSVFIYGPPGNGKTAMARAIGDFMNGSGGSIYVPYAIHGGRAASSPFSTRRCTRCDEATGGSDDDRRCHHPRAAQHRHGRRPLGPHPPAGRSSPAAN